MTEPDAPIELPEPEPPAKSRSRTKLETAVLVLGELRAQHDVLERHGWDDIPIRKAKQMKAGFRERCKRLHALLEDIELDFAALEEK